MFLAICSIEHVVLDIVVKFFMLSKVSLLG